MCAGDDDGVVTVSISKDVSITPPSSSSIPSITVADSSSSTSDSVFVNASCSLVRFLWSGSRGDIGGRGNLLLRVISVGGVGTVMTWLLIVELLFVTIDPADVAGTA